MEDPKVLFCSIHEVDLKPDTCNACLHVSHMIKANVLKELTKEGPKVAMGDVPSAAARFCRSYEKPPTLILSDSSMELATKIFSLGRTMNRIGLKMAKNEKNEMSQNKFVIIDFESL